MTPRLLSYGSVCSGIEAASAAWHALGWRAAWVSEIEAFPSAVIAARWPGVKNLGDMTTLPERILAREVEAPDILVGGTPCQAFSVAGLRGSLSDARGNLTLIFVRIADAIDAVRRADGRAPCWIVWENVPGVLSVSDNAFGAFLGGLVGSDAALEPPRGRGWTDAGVVSGPQRCAAWRVLDAQFFGLAQRRRRVFVLARAGAGSWQAADALLPVIESVRWHPAPLREARKEIARPIAAGSQRGSGYRNDADTADNLIPSTGELAHCLNAGGMSRQDYETETLVAHAGALDTNGHSVAVAFSCKDHGADAASDIAPTLRAMGHAGSRANGGGQMAVAFDTTQITSPSNYSRPQPGDPCHPLAAGAHPPAVAMPMQVRRLTPRECERLQGFPDDCTAIPWRGKPASECPDGPRYKALGNSMAVPVMRYLGERIAAVEAGR
jgi:DNA (cytosine-5)-methyltransferase 1